MLLGDGKRGRERDGGEETKGGGMGVRELEGWRRRRQMQW